MVSTRASYVYLLRLLFNLLTQTIIISGTQFTFFLFRSFTRCPNVAAHIKLNKNQKYIYLIEAAKNERAKKIMRHKRHQLNYVN